jgi:hypothetical protein
MKKLNKVGFFQELSHGDDDGPKLRELVQQHENDYEHDVIAYLLCGKEFITCLGFTSDVLNPDSGFKISPNITTDGVWAWPLDLAYYVKEYHVKLPDEFLSHMKRNQWVIPNITDNELMEFEI